MGYLHYFELLKLAPKYNSRSDRQDSKEIVKIKAYLLMFPSPEFSPTKDSLFRYGKTLVPFSKQMFQILLVMLYQVFDIYILCIWRISLNVATSVANYG